MVEHERRLRNAWLCRGAGRRDGRRRDVHEEIPMPERRDATLVAVSGALCLLALLFAQLSGRVIADESVHVPQIQWFLQGRFEPHPLLTTIPGYHLAVAALLKVASIESVAAMRAVGAGIDRKSTRLNSSH